MIRPEDVLRHLQDPPTFHLPTIHLNGTDAQSLKDEYRTLRKAVQFAEDALVAATCNGRDFYPQEPGAFEAARREREEMQSHLAQVRQYAERWELHAMDHIRGKD
jgi:hypothetical protein